MSTVRALNAGAPGAGTTTNLMSGLAKAWANLNGSTTTIRSSFNVSSVVNNGTGTYRYNYVNAMSAAFYTGTTSPSNSTGTFATTTVSGVNTSNVSFLTSHHYRSDTGNLTDIDSASILVHGDLA